MLTTLEISGMGGWELLRLGSPVASRNKRLAQIGPAASTIAKDETVANLNRPHARVAGTENRVDSSSSAAARP